MSVLTFDEASHTYRIDGQVVPGVTSVLKPLTDYSMVPPADLQAAADFGKAVHRACELDDLMDLPPHEAFARLRARDPVQATRFIAHCLPRLEAVRWLGQCLTSMAPTSHARRLAARKAVNRWLAEASDSNRRLAFQAGEAAGFGTAEGSACLAVFLSGGSMAPATQANRAESTLERVR